MPDPGTIFVMLIFGSIGMGYFIYGKKQQKYVPLTIGIALMVYSYFVSSITWNVIIGIVLSIIPMLIRI